jgi:predicted nucleotidyltransferase
MAAAASHAIDALSTKLGKRWESIDASIERAVAEQAKIASILYATALVPSDVSFVVFGSLARREWTIGSDVDWSLMIDGQADPGHLRIAQTISSHLMEAKLQSPGPTQTFGSLAFSHDIIHQIGGDADTNRNTTQRILLLLESWPIGNADAYDRVVKAVLNRYLDNDISFLSHSGQQYKVPRFLLNDIVRYWRTMCVDYANKFRERRGEKWAIRNAKLRLSRKLIFAAGLLTCFSCYLKPPMGDANLFDLPNHIEPLLAHIRTYVRMTPLEILADAAFAFAKPETAALLFDSYDRFLAMINDGEKRKQLSDMKAKEAQSSPLFREVRDISANFQKGLTHLFFDDHPKLTELTREYGVF